jgi:hypothetical protein
LQAFPVNGKLAISGNPVPPAPMQLLNNISLARALRATLCLQLLFASVYSNAQTCSDPVNVIYGITNAGSIHEIDVNTGIASVAINPAYPGNAPDQSNGLAYNSTNGKFYYFKRIPSSTITEFVSFDPATNAYSILANPSTTNSVYSGLITNDGSGYYCWDTQGTLFYYNIANNTWTTITSNIVDQFGKDVDSIIRLHYSGDGAIDGNGNLWMLPSSSSKYGLFRLNFPLPTTTVASITVQQVAAMTNHPSTFVGISFNSTGQIFMCTSAGNLYRLEDNLSLTSMSTFSTNMADLTSCNFPLAVLAGTDYHFTASLVNDRVDLAWKPSRQSSVIYTLERSADNRNWLTIAKGSDLNFAVNKISFTDAAPLYGRSFYRVKVVDAGNHISYSFIRTIELTNTRSFTIWPNPVINNLFIKNKRGKATAIVYAETGARVKSAIITSGLNNIDLKALPKGKYIVAVYAMNGNSAAFTIIKK